MNIQKFTNNGHGQFPLSTDSLNLLQENDLQLSSALCRALGWQYALLQLPTQNSDGVCVFDYVVMPLRFGSGVEATLDVSSLYVSRVIEQDDIRSGGVRYTGARVVTYATLTTSRTSTPVSMFVRVSVNDTLSELRSLIETLEQQTILPAGSIVPWRNRGDNSERRLPSQFPSGMVPCSLLEWSNAIEMQSALQQWREAYPDMITFAQASEKSARIATCCGYQIPALTETIAGAYYMLMKVR